MSVEELLRQEIEKCGMSYNEVGRRSGLTGATIARFMAREYSLRLTSAEKLFDLFGLKVVKARKRG